MALKRGDHAAGQASLSSLAHIPMRVLHTEWSTGWGGQEIRILAEMKGLRARGIELFLACRSGAKIGAAAEKENFTVFEIPFRGSFHLPSIFRLKRLIHEHRIDIVNTHSGKDSWNGGLAAKLAGARFVRTRHLYFKPTPLQMLWINRWADFVVTTGESLREHMIRDSRVRPDHIVSIPTGQNPEIYDPRRYDRAAERAQLGIPAGTVAVGMLAMFRRVKGTDLYLQMSEQLAARYPQAVFLIAGDGPQSEEINQFIRDRGLGARILRVGYLPQTAPYLSALDIFVLPSLMEGVPQTLIQALMLERACVATDVGSVRELLNDNFLMIEPGSPQALTEAVSRLLADRALTERLAGRARASVIERYSEQRMLDDMLEVYRRVMRRGSSRGH